MTVDTKGLIKTDMKNPFFIAGAIEGYIKRVCAVSRKEGSRMGDIRLASTGAGFLQFPFSVRTQARSLSVFFMCDNDHQEVVQGKKVSLSMGCSGISEPFMKGLLRVLRVFGPTYFDACDCDDIPAAEVWQDATPTVMDLLVARIDHASYVTVDAWIDLWKDNPCLQKERSLQEFIGLPEDDLQWILDRKKDYEKPAAERLGYDECQRYFTGMLNRYELAHPLMDLGIDEVYATFAEVEA